MSDYYKNLREKLGNQLLFMPAVVGVIRNKQDEILFGRKHNEENWGLIAGAIEIGETPAQAMVREAFEETGLDINRSESLEYMVEKNNDLLMVTDTKLST